MEKRMTREELLEECQSIVDEVCEKYNYDTNDIPGNDSLRTVLLKSILAILIDRPKEDRELFYQMLRHTPIIITEPNLTKSQLDELQDRYIGNINSHIQYENRETTEYTKVVGSGAYISAPVFSKDMQLNGKKSFIYIQKIDNEEKKAYLGTDINVSVLQHELGHAWNSEENEYVMSENGTLTRNCGASKMEYSFEKGQDGQQLQKCSKITGIFIEEAMNTIEEEKSMANYLGISKEEIKKLYNENKLDESIYSGSASSSMEYLLEKTSRDDFNRWRLYHDQNDIKEIEDQMKKTEFWKNREEDIKPESESRRNYLKKHEILKNYQSPEIEEFFKNNEDVFFPDISSMTPIDKIDNVLEQQCYCKKKLLLLYSVSPENTASLFEQIAHEIYPLINQTIDIKTKENIQQLVKDVKISSINEVTNETREGIQKLQKGELGQAQLKEQEGEENDR